jgi:hypothetical protein|nr:MAG TPA: hypothetical protein [Caudoviricetes sp.]
MNKEELIKEFNEKVEQLKDELIAKLEEKKKFEVKLPDMYDTLYYIDDICSEVYITNFVSSARDKDRYLRGFYFNTEEEAKQRLKEQRLLFKIKKWAEIHNEGWEPDWSDDEKKWYVYYNHVEERLNVTWGYNSTNFAKLPYFKTREIAQECIDLFGDEIKEVFC